MVSVVTLVEGHAEKIMKENYFLFTGIDFSLKFACVVSIYVYYVSFLDRTFRNFIFSKETEVTLLTRKDLLIA